MTAGRGMGIASLVFGIISLVMLSLFFLGPICGVLALVLGVVALSKRPEGKAMPIIGIVTGSLGTLLALVIMMIYAGGIAIGDMSEIDELFDVLIDLSV